jgi:hypothetical protein
MNLVNPTVSVGGSPCGLTDRLNPISHGIEATPHSFVVWHHHADSFPHPFIDLFIGGRDI